MGLGFLKSYLFGVLEKASGLYKGCEVTIGPSGLCKDCEVASGGGIPWGGGSPWRGYNPWGGCGAWLSGGKWKPFRFWGGGCW